MKILPAITRFLPLVAAIMVLGQAHTLKAQSVGEDYFPGDYVFGQDMTPIYPNASIYSPLYWYNLAGSGAPARIFLHPTYSTVPDSLALTPDIELMAIWTNGCVIILADGFADSIWPGAGIIRMPHADDDPLHGTTGIRG